jgi:hypothetical protein
MNKKSTARKPRKELRPMTASAIERAALSDPDALPLSGIDLRHMKRTPPAKIIHRALRITREEFSK